MGARGYASDSARVPSYVGYAMSAQGYILAIDQGTTGTTAMLLDRSGSVVWQVSNEITQIYPRPGWVEHDPNELFDSCIAAVDELLEETEISPRQIAALGIANQRETALVWERRSGKPAHNAIVWQCRRTAPLCERLKSRGLEAAVRDKTGLPIDAYFSATKIRWLLDAVPDGQRRADDGELAFGTVDSWLLWNLTNGTLHATDVTNASRTMLYNINALAWDAELLAQLNIPASMMPQVMPSSGVFGYTGGNFFGGQAIPIAGVAGDQQAALFGQACFAPGMTKNTYGTGSFVLMNTGNRRIASAHNLISTIAWGIGDEITYALEGSIFSTGATVQWLRDGLGVIQESARVEALAATVPNNGGVYLAPAFTGLGAPHWDMYARGAIVGITRGATAAHIARAALESTAYQTADVVNAMVKDTALMPTVMRADGGGSANNLMMQFQADMLGMPVERPVIAETTALGAAYLAGLAIGFWQDVAEIAAQWKCDRRFAPTMPQPEAEALYADWLRAVERSKRWAAHA